MDKRLANKIRELVHDGYTKVTDIEKPLGEFSKTLCDNPNQFNRRFCPNRKEIYTVMYKEILSGRFSANDQINCRRFCDEYKDEFPEDEIYFRAASCTEDSIESLLFVHQSTFQKNLIQRYGGEMILMDGTYNTCKYDLSTYFLCVCTNTGYQVVATFILDKETTHSIQEALQIIQTWNPTWNPRRALVDFDQREITALERTFKDISVYLCQFHVLQAWERWLTSKKNGMTNMKEEIIKKLRNLASCDTQEKYNELVDAFRESECFESEKFKNWMEKKWLNNSQRWVLAFREEHSTRHIKTTNGVERVHREFKRNFLDKFGEGKTLESEIRVLLRKFLPSMQTRYLAVNHKGKETTRKYQEGLESFLINRPKKFVTHMLNRIPPEYKDILETFEDGVDSFIVESHSGKEYCVTFPEMKCKCTCKDWINSQWPCEHIIAIILRYPDYAWENLNSEYTEQSCFTLHDSSTAEMSELNEMVTVFTPQDKVGSPSTDSDFKRCLDLIKNITAGIYNVHQDKLEIVLHKLEETEAVISNNIEKIGDLPVRKRKKKKRSKMQSMKVVEGSTATSLEQMEQVKSISVTQKIVPLDSTFDMKDEDQAPCESPYEPHTSHDNDTFLREMTRNVEERSEAVIPQFIDWTFTEQDEQELNRIWVRQCTGKLIGHIGPYCLTDESFDYIKSTLSDEFNSQLFCSCTAEGRVAVLLV